MLLKDNKIIDAIKETEIVVHDEFVKYHQRDESK